MCAVRWLRFECHCQLYWGALEEEDHWSYGLSCYFQPYWFCKLLSTVNYYGKASSSQRTTFENMPNEGRETRSGNIRMCKIPGRYKSWCKRAWKNCNVWRWVNEIESLCSCTLFTQEVGGYWEGIVWWWIWETSDGFLLTSSSSETNSRQPILPIGSFGGRRREIGTDIPLREFILGAKIRSGWYYQRGNK